MFVSLVDFITLAHGSPFSSFCNLLNNKSTYFQPIGRSIYNKFPNEIGRCVFNNIGLLQTKTSEVLTELFREKDASSFKSQDCLPGHDKIQKRCFKNYYRGLVSFENISKVLLTQIISSVILCLYESFRYYILGSTSICSKRFKSLYPVYLYIAFLYFQKRLHYCFNVWFSRSLDSCNLH